MALTSHKLLENKVALITGANRGIGLEIAKQFVNQGCIVYANAREEGSLQNLKSSVADSSKIVEVYFDVTNEAKSKGVIQQIYKEQKRLDCLVNNAGIMQDSILGMISHSQMENSFNINTLASINLMQLSSRLMKRNASGSIINISSVVGLKGAVGQVAYSASKGAMISATLSASKELASSGIRVNAIAPGMIDTDLLSNFSPEKKLDLIKNIGFGRIGKPEDVAGTAIYLASDLSLYVTGQVIEVSGGLII